MFELIYVNFSVQTHVKILKFICKNLKKNPIKIK